MWKGKLIKLLIRRLIYFVWDIFEICIFSIFKDIKCNCLNKNEIIV